ncbi:MAG TPA: serine O-acetyltransferase [Methylocystis sp.]|nr:serine O-acetyltransferase [Methylocystis sp.]
MASLRHLPRLLELLGEDLACVATRDPAARGKIETLLTYPGVHALLWHRLANVLWRRDWRFLARLVSWFARFLTNIDIHPGATIGRRFFIDHGAGVVIGETAVVRDDVTIYHGVTLGGVSWSPGKRHPTVESGVVIGAGAKILGPITIGQNARVGANSVVIESVTRDATVVGIPARTVMRDAGRYTFGGRVNLNHHLIPDPVGEAFSVLADRIEFLEARVSHLQQRLKERAKPRSGEGSSHRIEPPRII